MRNIASIAFVFLSALIIFLFLSACARVGGGTKHTVSGEVVVKIEFGMCDDLPVEAKIECVKSLLQILEQYKTTGEK